MLNWLIEELALEQYTEYVSPVIYQVPVYTLENIHRVLSTNSGITCHVFCEDAPELMEDIHRYTTIIARTIFRNRMSGHQTLTPVMRILLPGDYVYTAIVRWEHL